MAVAGSLVRFLFHVLSVEFVDVNDFVDVEVDTKGGEASSCGMAGAASLVINSDYSILESFGCFSCIFFPCFLVIFFFRQIPSHGNTAEVVLTALHRYNYHYKIWLYIYMTLFLIFFINRNLLGVDQFLGR